MGNVFEKGTKFAATALELLKKELKVAGIFVHKYGVADFTGAEDDTINIKRPPMLRARDKGWRNDNEIVVDKIMQSRIKVTLSAHPYSAVELSPEEATLDEVDYVRDVQAPQVRSILDFYEERAADTLAEAKYVNVIVYNPAGTGAVADARKVASRARKLFQDANVPTNGRYWLVGSSVAEAISNTDKLIDVDSSGLPENLREGVVTKLRGFWVVEWPTLGENESYFVHETALALAAVAPKVPNGAKGGGTISGNGLAVTQIWDYDGKTLKDRSIVHAFAGFAEVTDPEIETDKASENYGKIVLGTDGKPNMDFFRAIKVDFVGEGEAPDTDSSKVWTSALTGVPTGGTYLLDVDGTDTEPIAFDATNAVIAAALNELDGVSGAKVTGTTTKTVKFASAVILDGDGEGLTGGTNPDVVLTKV